MKARNGSIILIILFFAVCTLLMATLVVRTSSLFHDAAIARYQYQKNFFLTDGLLRCAYAICKKNSAAFARQGALNQIDCMLAFPTWPPYDRNAQYHGRVHVFVDDGRTIKLAADLMHQMQVVFSLEAHLVPIKMEGCDPASPCLQVVQWRIKNT